MAHKQQIKFCASVKQAYPQFFINKNVLDVGSLNINGCNRNLFHDGTYVGVDIYEGKNVDHVIPIHQYKSSKKYGVVISTEMLEHDMHWKESLKAMYSLLEDGGLFLLTCATIGRKEHGTYQSEPKASPGTLGYYKNILAEEFEQVLPRALFTEYKLQVVGTDLQFYGIKCKSFTVIIPTMYYHVASLQRIVDLCSRIPSIYEVLIVNNNKVLQKEISGVNVRIIGNGSNIYVNPSWDLGVFESKTENIILMNDDIEIKGDFQAVIHAVIEFGLEGKKIIGPSKHCYSSHNLYVGKIGIEAAPVNTMNHGFGVCMFMRKDTYISTPIDKGIKVWYGDRILYQQNQPYNFKGIEIVTSFGGTTKKIDLKGVAKKEKQLFDTIYKDKIMKNTLNIVTVLQTGGRYTLQDVRLLAYHLHKWKGDAQIRVHCINNKFEKNVTLFGINFIPMPYKDWKSWWSKMNLFAPAFQISVLKPFLYLDLDTVIIADYGSIIPKQEKEKFIMLQDFYRPALAASGMMWLPDAKKLDYIWDYWISKPNDWISKLRGDQDYLQLAGGADCFWQQKTTRIGSFKPAPSHLPLKEKPEDRAIVCFHGKPSIWEAAESIEWIKDYVHEYQEKT